MIVVPDKVHSLTLLLVEDISAYIITNSPAVLGLNDISWSGEEPLAPEIATAVPNVREVPLRVPAITLAVLAEVELV